MQKLFIQIVFIGFFLLGFSSIETFAQTPLQGKWDITIQTQRNTIVFPFTFKPGNKGTVETSVGVLQIAYRENGDNFSITTEFPKEIDPAMGAASLIIRGKKSGGADLTADAIFFTEKQDTSSKLKVTTLVRSKSVTGKRK